MDTPSQYLPIDRRLALTQGVALPERATGAVLFADISGFTALTNAVVAELGASRGAEAITMLLNRAYLPLSAAIDRYGGSVVALGGDSLTAWFDGDDGRRAVACGLTGQAAFAALDLGAQPVPPGAPLTLKATVATGSVRRLLVGDPALNWIEVLAGSLMRHLANAAASTQHGEVVLDVAPGDAALDAVVVGEWRAGLTNGRRYAVVDRLAAAVEPRPWPAQAEGSLAEEQARPWLLPAVYARLQGGQGEFLAELRQTVSLFLRFGDLDYDHDDGAVDTLDAFVRWVQGVLTTYGGALLGVVIGDKGNHLYATFGAPTAHPDDALRAVAAALDLRQLPAHLAHVGPVAIGLSAGQSWAGAYGGTTRDYSVIGESMNLAARLMEVARPGQVLLSADLVGPLGGRYELTSLTSMTLKGRDTPVAVAAVLGRPAPSPLRAQAEASTSPLVGRQEPLTLIADRLALARQRHGQVVAVLGEPGVGKSRLAAEVVRRAAANGLAVYAGEAEATGPSTAYLAWQGVWQGFFNIDMTADTDRHMAALTTALAALDPALLPRLPLLGAALGLTLPDNDLTSHMDGRLRKESREALLVECLRRRSAAMPMVLMVEDIQWLDPLSADLLEAIGRAIVDMPVLLLLTGHHFPQAPSGELDLIDLAHVTRLGLTDLSQPETEALIARRGEALFAPSGPLPVEFVRAIAARTEGNPLYVEELLNYLHDRRISPQDSGALDRLDLPAHLTSVILGRIDQLSAAQQTTLKVASVVGRSFPLAWLWGVYDRLGAEEAVRQDVAALVGAGLLMLDPTGEATYAFRHALIRDAAYSSLPFAFRAELHERLAAWLEARPHDDSLLDRLAYHYGQSANVAKQREYFRKAGDAARERYANAVAVDYYQRLLDVAPPADRAAALVALAQALESLGAWVAAEGQYRAVLDLPDEERPAALAARAELGVGSTLRWQTAYLEALAWLDRACRSLAAVGDQGGVCEALLTMGFVYWRQHRLADAHAAVERALAVAQASGDSRQTAEAYHLLGLLTAAGGNYDGAERWWQESLALRQSIGDRLGVMAATTNLGMVDFKKGRYEAHKRIVEQNLALASEIGSRRGYGINLGALADAQLREGDAIGARVSQAQALALFRDLGLIPEIIGALGGVAEIAQVAEDTRDASLAAARILGGSARLMETYGCTTDQYSLERMAAAEKHAREALGDEAFEAAWAEGHQMEWEDVVSYALAYP